MSSETETQPRRVMWSPLIRGVVAVLFGLLALFWPGITVLALVLVFGAFAIVDGVMAIGGAISARRESGGSRTLYGVMGALGIIAGVVAFFWPAITAIALAWVIAFWAIFTGALEIGAAFTSKSWSGHFGWLALISGALSVILGILIAVQPGAGAVALAWLIGALALVWGIVLILAGFGARPASSGAGQQFPGGGTTATET